MIAALLKRTTDFNSYIGVFVLLAKDDPAEMFIAEPYIPVTNFLIQNVVVVALLRRLKHAVARGCVRALCAKKANRHGTLYRQLSTIMFLNTYLL